MSKQQQYETAKQRLRSKNLSPAEYERQIQQLLKNILLVKAKRVAYIPPSLSWGFLLPSCLINI